MGAENISMVEFEEQVNEFIERLGKAVLALTEMSVTAERGTDEKRRLQAKSAAVQVSFEIWDEMLNDVWMGVVPPSALKGYFTNIDRMAKASTGGAREGYNLVLDYGRSYWKDMTPA